MSEKQGPCCKVNRTCKAITGLLLLSSLDLVEGKKPKKFRRTSRKTYYTTRQKCKEGYDLARALCSTIPWEGKETSANLVLNACKSGERVFNGRMKELASLCEAKGSRKEQLKEDLMICKKAFSHHSKGFCEWYHKEELKTSKAKAFKKSDDNIKLITSKSMPKVPHSLQPKFVRKKGGTTTEVELGADDEIYNDLDSYDTFTEREPDHESSLSSEDSSDGLEDLYDQLESYFDDPKDKELLHELAMGEDVMSGIPVGGRRGRGRKSRNSRRRRRRRSTAGKYGNTSGQQSGKCTIL